MKALAIVLFGLCPTEDSVGCVWNAETQGNGEGRSFLALPTADPDEPVLLFFGLD